MANPRGIASIVTTANSPNRIAEISPREKPMTRKVANMTEFLKNNRKDKHNTRALQQLLSKRRKMLKYLMRQSRARYYDTIRKLGLRDIYGDKVLKRHGAVKKYPAAKMKGSY